MAGDHTAPENTGASSSSSSSSSHSHAAKASHTHHAAHAHQAAHASTAHGAHHAAASSKAALGAKLTTAAAISTISAHTHLAVGGVTLTGPTISGALVTGAVVGAGAGLFLGFLVTCVFRRGCAPCGRCQGHDKCPEKEGACTGCSSGAVAGAAIAVGGAAAFGCLSHKEMVAEGLAGGAVGAGLGCCEAVSTREKGTAEKPGESYWWI
eukprot:Sspe_Gene.73446::Locus_44333_Transcript_1_1_Confidence_1.000_Length_2226::g.73446::m.73446